MQSAAKWATFFKVEVKKVEINIFTMFWNWVLMKLSLKESFTFRYTFQLYFLSANVEKYISNSEVTRSKSDFETYSDSVLHAHISVCVYTLERQVYRERNFVVWVNERVGKAFSSYRSGRISPIWYPFPRSKIKGWPLKYRTRIARGWAIRPFVDSQLFEGFQPGLLRFFFSSFFPFRAFMHPFFW